jgi:hypothetical protein
MSTALACAVAVLSAAFVAVYLPDLGHGFIKDDFAWILSSRSSSLADLLAILGSNLGFYRPLVAFSFAADYAVWGLDPFGYGLTNLALCAGCAGLLYLLGRRFALPPAAAVLGTGVWAFNFHGVNMALLWISGRTSLLVTLFSLATAHAVAAGAGWLAGALCLAALLSKEEAVALPFLFTAFLAATAAGDRGARLRAALSRTWPLWMSLLIYLALRTGSGAFGPLDAPPYYQFSFSPQLVLRNIGEYADRSGTVTAGVALLLLAAARRFRPDLTAPERKVLLFAAIWVPCTFALTLWLPARSSLYALLPSVGSALAAGTMASWAARANPAGFRTLAICLALLVVLLIPVYRMRNVSWVTTGEMTGRVMEVLRARTRGSAPGGSIVLIDAPGERFNLDAAFGGLFPDAVALVLGSGWNGRIVAPGEPMPADVRFSFRFGGGQLTPATEAR